MAVYANDMLFSADMRNWAVIAVIADVLGSKESALIEKVRTVMTDVESSTRYDLDGHTVQSVLQD